MSQGQGQAGPGPGSAGGAPSPPACVAVAYSGGRDSLALLHATCRAAQGSGLAVVALHVHHNLLPEADAWLQAAQARVAAWRRRGWPLSLRHTRLSGAPAPGQSVEAWARTGRYQALTRMAQEAGASLLLLAHHRRDQAETVLLQALRGAGPAGLAAMPAQIQRAGLCWARPWLAQPRSAIEAYVRQHRLKPVEDPSNADTRYARNRLRLAVWPALNTAFAQAESALAAVAQRAQRADAALAELAELDLTTCCDAQERLSLPAWRALSTARQDNALRHWWRRQTGRGPSEPLVARLLAELPAERYVASGLRRWPALAGVEAVLQGDALALRVADAAVPATRPPIAPSTPLQEAVLDLSQPGRHPVPAWGGHWWVEACAREGLGAEQLRQACLRPRQGGERFQLGPGRPPRTLKKQYQALGLADGRARQGPLLWCAGQLLYVPGLGIDARAWAPEGQAQWRLRWCPDDASGVSGVSVGECAGGPDSGTN